MHDNVAATKSLIAISSEIGVKSWLFVSSVSTMPTDINSPLDGTAAYGPISDYGKSKMLAEKAFVEMQHKNPTSTSVSIIRPTVIYGPSDPEYTGIYRAVDNNIFRLIDGIYSGRFAIIGNGKTLKTTAYVKNFVQALIFLLKENRSGCEKYVYADQPPMQTSDLVFIIRSLLGKKGLGMKVPLWLALPFATLGDFLAQLTGINLPITKSRIETFNRSTNFLPTKLIELGFSFPYETEEALSETVDWYLELKKKHNKSFFFFSKDIE